MALEFNNTSIPATPRTDAQALAGGATPTTAGAQLPQGVARTASFGKNDPQKALYGGFKVTDPTTMNAGTFLFANKSAEFLKTPLGISFYDPAGPAARPEGGREYQGAWVDPYKYDGTNGYPDYRHDLGGGDKGTFAYNHSFFAEMAHNAFDDLTLKKEMVRPHWWLNRVPRTAFKLHNGTVGNTRIYRGGLSTYGGLSRWQDLAADPTSVDACRPMKFSTYQYAWETISWSGKKTAWGSDPICVDNLMFVPNAAEYIGWILETGVKFGTDIQNIWNRDMYIFTSVMAGRSFVMTSEYRGDASPRYVYNPYCFLDAADGAGSDLHAEKNAVDGHPFIIFDASAGVEPFNPDVLNLVRDNLKRRATGSAVGTIGNEAMFAIAMSVEDVENYIRGNEEERKYWVEANPQALIQHYGFAPTTFRRWVITDDGDQLRFKLKTFIPKGTAISVLAKYGNVGKAEFTDGASVGEATKCDLWVAVMVDPEIGGRPGINGAPIPVPNPEYTTAEIAIAPIFMQNVFTNQFVPDDTYLGSGTWFGPKKGLNGKWAWHNFPSENNPEQRIGNFYGEFRIVPKPDISFFDTISFMYRRCMEPLPSMCPNENPKINPAAAKVSAKVGVALTGVTKTANTADLKLADALALSAGDKFTVTATHPGATDSDPAVEVTLTGIVFSSLTGTHKQVQFVIASDDANTYSIAEGATITVG